MYFSRIELHNYGIYKGTHEMELQDRFDKRNITLVGGLNGRGKTTLHDAILIALYDKQALKYIQEKYRSFDKLLQEHINKHATDTETYIAVTLILDDGTELRVKRSWSKAGSRISQTTIIEKNGVEDNYLASNWNYYVEEILPFGIARFFFFNNEKISQIADDTSFEQIKSSIKSAIGVTAIENAIKHTDDVIRRKESAIKSFEYSELNQSCQEVESRIAELDIGISGANKELTELEDSRDRLAASLEAAEKEFWARGGELGLNRDAIKAEKNRIALDVASIQNEIIQVASDASTPLFMCASLVTQSYDKEKGVQEEKARRYSESVVTLIYDKLIKKIDERNFDPHTRDAIKVIIREELKQYMASPEQTEGRSLTPSSMILFEKLITTIFSSIILRITTLVLTIQEQENRRLNLDTHLENADEQTLAIQLYDALKGLQEEKGAVDADYKRVQTLLDSMKQQREVLKNKWRSLLSSIAEKKSSHDDDARIVKYAAMSINVQKQFMSRLQKQKISKLSQAVTDCFRRLVEKDSFISRIEIDPMTLDITMLGSDERELLKSQLSAGEQQMFAISIVWALALTSGYKAPVVIDTPLARLDSVHRVNFLSKYLPEASSQVIVLSTDEEVTDRYHELIRENIVDYYTLLYHENEQCTSIVPGYFEEV